MNSLHKKLLILCVMSAVVLAGVFCYESIMVAHDDCMGKASSVWCDDFILHGTLISYALMGLVFVFSVTLVAFFTSFFDYGKQLRLSYVRQYHYLKRVVSRLFQPLAIAFSKGILHPYIP